MMTINSMRMLNKKEKGNITIIALMILVILTTIGISASTTTNTDMLIAKNEIPYKQNFYIAEGGLNREAAEIGSGNYPIADINTQMLLADEEGIAGGGELPGGTDSHNVSGKPYEFDLYYKGYYPPPKGFSAVHFNRYDYQINVRGGDTDKVYIASRYYKIGPKAD